MVPEPSCLIEELHPRTYQQLKFRLSQNDAWKEVAKELFNPPLQHPLVQQIHDLLAGLCHADTRITFLWLPSHMGIVGNELADQATKEAVSLPPRPVEVPARDIRSQLRLQVLAFWESQWLADPLPSKLRAIKGGGALSGHGGKVPLEMSDMGGHPSHGPKLEGTETPILKEQDSNLATKEKVKYGELVILGYNGFLPPGDRGRRRSKLVLYGRDRPNGVKRSKHYVVTAPHESKAILDNRQHSITYSSSKTQATVVEYTLDEKTDMFQIGRSSEAPIDFVVMDVVPGNQSTRNEVVRSTVSRFACRILVDRNSPHIARIYAAGFDSSRNIVLGEEATKWQKASGETDGLTTNGILICHPQGSFCGGDAKSVDWHEVSVDGGIFALRPSRCARQKSEAIEDEDNVLKDGTLIDICGATLLWRSAEGLWKSPTKEDLEMSVDELNKGKPMCPVGLNTLVLPRKISPNVNNYSSETQQQPLVYLNCGHVQGHHNWGQGNDSSRCCPLCRTRGPVVKLCMGMEPAFYVDSGPPTHAFNPCGHMASEKSVKYWAASVGIPHGTNGFYGMCPFCITHLEGHPGYIRLIFQDPLD